MGGAFGHAKFGGLCDQLENCMGDPGDDPTKFHDCAEFVLYNWLAKKGTTIDLSRDAEGQLRQIALALEKIALNLSDVPAIPPVDAGSQPDTPTDSARNPCDGLAVAMAEHKLAVRSANKPDSFPRTDLAGREWQYTDKGKAELEAHRHQHHGDGTESRTTGGLHGGLLRMQSLQLDVVKAAQDKKWASDVCNKVEQWAWKGFDLIFNRNYPLDKRHPMP
jgi:hypothetical protein